METKSKKQNKTIESAIYDKAGGWLSERIHFSVMVRDGEADE